MSGTNIQKDSKTVDDKQSEVQYEERKETVEELNLEQQASLAEDSKEETTSKAEDATPMSRVGKKKKGKRKKNKKKRRPQRSQSLISSGASDPNLSKEEDEV